MPHQLQRRRHGGAALAAVATVLLCLGGGLTPQRAAALDCHANCTLRGNCNVEEGRCECPFGFTGPTCEEPMLRACQHAPDGHPHPGTWFPKNCECYRQARKFFDCDERDCQWTALHWRWGGLRCYEYDALPPEQQYSWLPVKGTQGVTWREGGDIGSPDPKRWFRASSEQSGRVTIDLWQNKAVPRPMKDCRNNCTNGNGVCMSHDEVAPARCNCQKGYHGEVCDQVFWPLCPNECNKRGSCVRGFCHCHPPFFGLGCARSKAAAPRPNALPSHTKALIYMYELPSHVAFPIALDDNLDDRPSVYMAYEHFLNLFVNDWGTRTDDPLAANLFYIPAFSYSYTSNVNHPDRHIRNIVRYISATYPYWNRTGGRDHFLWFPADRGACFAPPEARHMIKLSHFGFSVDRRAGDRSVIQPQPRDEDHGCLNPARDVVTAPWDNIGHREAHHVYLALRESSGHDPNRKHLFMFAGGVRLGDPTYSGGVRQDLFNFLQEKKKTDPDSLSDVLFVDGHVPDYRGLLLSSKFCLAPYGHGFGIRLVTAMMHACIPVVIQDKVYQPYDQVLPYYDFSLRLGRKDIPQLLQILRDVTDEEQARLRRGMGLYYRAFIWEADLGGQAYNYTIKALHKRLQNMWADLYHHHH